MSHLFFANDCFLYFKANEGEASIIKEIIKEYGYAYGQQINCQKSTISFSRCNTSNYILIVL